MYKSDLLLSFHLCLSAVTKGCKKCLFQDFMGPCINIEKSHIEWRAAIHVRAAFLIHIELTYIKLIHIKIELMSD